MLWQQREATREKAKKAKAANVSNDIFQIRDIMEDGGGDAAVRAGDLLS